MNATELLADLAEVGVEVVAQGNGLRYRPQDRVTPEMLERLKTHKGELLAILGPSGGFSPPCRADMLASGSSDVPGSSAVAGSAAEWDDCIEPPEPCPGCGGISFWWNPLGNRRCTTCRPPTAARKLRQRAERIRQRHGIRNTTQPSKQWRKKKRIDDA